MNICVFDIETIPDTDAGRKLYGLTDLSDKDVAEIMFHKRRQKTGNDFLPMHLQRVVAISVFFRTPKIYKLWTLGDVHSSEADIVQRFFKGIEDYRPVLISWNGGGFDLPVLNYRGLLHGVQAQTYWEQGDEDREFRWNNYISRFHWRHMDLMDILSGFQLRGTAPLDEVSTMLGFPGKLGMSGDLVWDSYLNGELEKIRDYCETDVMNTYLVYLRFELMRRNLTEQQYEEELQRARDYLKQEAEQKPHWQAFLQAWV